MTTDIASVESTTVLDKLLPSLEINPTVSFLLSEKPGRGEPFASFFASTYVQSVPSGTSWLTEHLGDVDFSTLLLGDTLTICRFWPHPVRGREEVEDESAPPQEEPAQEPKQAAFMKANADRIQLLARMYVAKDKISDEQSARLAIVTERVRRLLPAVSAEEYEALEARLKEVEAVAALNAKLRDRLAKFK